MLRRLGLACAIAAATAVPARADETTPPAAGAASPPAAGTDEAPIVPAPDQPVAAAPPAVGPARRAAAIGLALVPGVATRGLGSYVARQPHATRRLLWLGGIGLGALIVGGVPIAATYGSPRLIVPGVHLVVGGTGLILGSWFGDIWVAAGGDRLRGRSRALPDLAIELRGRWQHHAYVGDRLLLQPALDLRRGPWAARAAALGATDGSAWGGRLDGEVRPWRRGAIGAPHHTGTHVAVRAAVEVHHERDEAFALTTGELAVRGRLDLAELAPPLAGTFVELEEGLGLELASYDAAGTDVNTVLLSRAAWGVYLPCGRGELQAFYDHRRDHLAGGFPAGRAAGFFGSLGASAEVMLAPGWTALAVVEVGASRLVTIGLRRELR